MRATIHAMRSGFENQGRPSSIFSQESGRYPGWRLRDGDDPAEMVAALDEAGLTWAAYFIIRAEEGEDPGGRGAVGNQYVPRSPVMKPEKAKRQLERMLLSFTPGSVVMLLGEVFREMGREAREDGSEAIADNYEIAESSLTVLGLGLDALLPKPKGR